MMERTNEPSAATLPNVVPAAMETMIARILLEYKTTASGSEWSKKVIP